MMLTKKTTYKWQVMRERRKKESKQMDTMELRQKWTTLAFHCFSFSSIHLQFNFAKWFSMLFCQPLFRRFGKLDDCCVCVFALGIKLFYLFFSFSSENNKNLAKCRLTYRKVDWISHFGDITVFSLLNEFYTWYIVVHTI